METPTFRTGFIINRGGDLFWFLGLPFLAIGVALACQQWLPAVAIASVSLWITAPHHFVTWLRAYGLKEDWQRFKGRLVIGPLVLVGLTLSGMAWAPITLILIITLWDHQHSLMQQHGFARIYDFKAQTSAPSTGRFDLALNWILYGNLFLTAPFFTPFWVREAIRCGVPVTLHSVEIVQTVSWSITAVYCAVYLGHVIWCHRNGYALNPIKYAFLASSYFLWYFVCSTTESFLVYTIAHRLTHGLQYIVIVHLYLQHKTSQQSESRNWLAWLVRPRHIFVFVASGVAYAVFYQLMTRQPLADFGFGVVGVASMYGPIPEMGMPGLSEETAFELFATVLLQVAGPIHYYFDSFIWKVRDHTIQEGL